jgi:hypothetical protein
MKLFEFRKRNLNKKGYQFTQLPMLAIVFGIAIVATVVIASITQNLRDNQTSNTYARNISNYGLQGLNELGSWYDMLGMIIAASVIITTLFVVFKGMG